MLAQAQKTIKRFGWNTGAWFVQESGVCLEGAVGIRGHDRRTKTAPRMEACRYIQKAADEILGADLELASARDAVPAINDQLVGTEKCALEILELAEVLAYKDWLDEQFTITFNEGEEDEEDVTVEIF